MIDFLKFVNSDTVRNHLQQIRYQPTALEAAWLTWQCETISLEEKCAAWREIIETLPDCPTNSRMIICSHLSRNALYRKVPVLSDIKFDTKYIDEIIFILDKEEYHGLNKELIVVLNQELIVVQKEGLLKRVKLKWLPEYLKYIYQPTKRPE